MEAILSDAGFQVRYQSSKRNWKKALDEAKDFAVAAGGDGTVAKVFRYLAGRDVPVAVIAMGTANNLARSLELLGDMRQLVQSWDLYSTHAFDVGECRSFGRREPRLFVEACGGGLFGSAIERGKAEVEQPGTFVGSELDRALTLLLDIVENSEPAHWGVEVDGTDHSGDFLAVEAMNIRLTGPGVTIAPDARPDDGLFDVVLVRPEDRDSFLDYVRKRLAHVAHEPLGHEILRGSHVVLRPPEARMRLDDGMVSVRRPVELTIRAGAVRYIGPNVSN